LTPEQALSFQEAYSRRLQAQLLQATGMVVSIESVLKPLVTDIFTDIMARLYNVNEPSRSPQDIVDEVTAYAIGSGDDINELIYAVFTNLGINLVLYDIESIPECDSVVAKWREVQR
jgi:hypothetical protein